jgi:hypothetical protein
MRTAISAYEQDGMIPVFVGADKAYITAAHWDTHGFPKTRSAAKREVEYFTMLVKMKECVRNVKVWSWPRTEDARKRGLQITTLPNATANGFGRQPWMDDPVSSLSRELWRDFILSAGFKELKVWVPSLMWLHAKGYVDVATVKTDIAIAQILGPRLKEIAIAKGLVQAGENVTAAEVKSRLRAASVTVASARLDELTEPGLRKQSETRRAVHRWLDRVYRDNRRDFAKAYSYPEYLDLGEGLPPVPLLLFWDKPHDCKNGRMASANDLKRGARAAAAATNAVEAAGADGDDAGEGDLFDEDETIMDAVDEAGGGGFAAAEGTLAHAVGLAARAVIGVTGQKLLHPRTMDPTHDPQHVPTATALFSHKTAEEMRRLGHTRAAEWVHTWASDYLATDKRGPCPSARWDAWAALDKAVYALDRSLHWDVDTLEWHTCKTSSIEGYSRVLIESKLISSDSSRYLDVMVGHRGCRVVYDRRKGSDLCESLFSRCVVVMDQNKASKHVWLRMFGKILRQARRQTMDPDLRGTPMFSQQVSCPDEP